MLIMSNARFEAEYKNNVVPCIMCRRFYLAVIVSYHKCDIDKANIINIYDSFEINNTIMCITIVVFAVTHVLNSAIPRAVCSTVRSTNTEHKLIHHSRFNLQNYRLSLIFLFVFVCDFCIRKISKCVWYLNKIEQ